MNHFPRAEERPFETPPAPAPQDKRARLEARTTAPPTVTQDAVWGEWAALLYYDLASFAARSFRELNPRTRFAANWRFDLVAAKLEAVREGRIRRLIVSLPPRHLKSHLASIAFPACVSVKLRLRAAQIIAGFEPSEAPPAQAARNGRLALFGGQSCLSSRLNTGDRA